MTADAVDLSQKFDLFSEHWSPKLVARLNDYEVKLVKVNIYLTDMSNFPKIVALRAKHFSKPYPADTIVEVRALALPELMIEIEAMALVEGEVVD